MGATTKPKPKASAPQDPLKDRKDDEGNLIDPPVIPEFERRLVAAHDSGDDLLIEEITEEYSAEREKVALADHKREQKRRERAAA